MHKSKHRTSIMSSHRTSDFFRSVPAARGLRTMPLASNILLRTRVQRSEAIHRCCSEYSKLIGMASNLRVMAFNRVGFTRNDSNLFGSSYLTNRTDWCVPHSPWATPDPTAIMLKHPPTPYMVKPMILMVESEMFLPEFPCVTSLKMLETCLRLFQCKQKANMLIVSQACTSFVPTRQISTTITIKQ